MTIAKPTPGNTISKIDEMIDAINAGGGGSSLPTFTVADTGKALEVVSGNQIDNISIDGHDYTGGTFSITLDGTEVVLPPGSTGNSVQQTHVGVFVASASGGTFDLSIDGDVVPGVAWDADGASVLQPAIIAAIPTLAGHIAVIGAGPSVDDYTIAFTDAKPYTVVMDPTNLTGPDAPYNAFSNNDTDASIGGYLHKGIPALANIVTESGDLGIAIQLEFIDAAPHTVAASGALLTGPSSPYTMTVALVQAATAPFAAWETISGGGGAGNDLFFTFGTPGIVSFGGAGATPAAMLALATAQGDGVDDAVALNALITTVAGMYPPTAAPSIFILPGLYIIGSTPIDPQGVLLRGSGSSITQIYNSPSLGSIVGTRTIDTSDAVYLESLVFVSLGSGAATIFGATVGNIRSCSFTIDDTGVDPAALYFSDGGTSAIGTPSITDSSFLGQAGLSTPVLQFGSGGGGSSFLVSNNVFAQGTFLVDSISEWTFTDNHLTESNQGGTPLALIKIQNGSEQAIVQGNLLKRGQAHGIHLDHANRLVIQDNLLADYDSSGTATYSGIFVDNNSDENFLSGNKFVGGIIRAAFGVRINSVDCDNNFVSANDIFDGGAVNYSDAGTTTTSTGNRI